MGFINSSRSRKSESSYERRLCSFDRARESMNEGRETRIRISTFEVCSLWANGGVASVTWLKVTRRTNAANIWPSVSTVPERERERLGSMQFGSVIDKPRFKTAFPPYFVRRDWNNKSPRARQCSNRINTPPPAFQNRRKTGRSRNNNFSTPNSETDFRDGRVYKGNNDPWNVWTGTFHRNFDRIKVIVICPSFTHARLSNFLEFFHRQTFTADSLSGGISHRYVVCFASKRLQSQLNWQATSKSRAAPLSCRNNRSQLNNVSSFLKEKKRRRRRI